MWPFKTNWKQCAFEWRDLARKQAGQIEQRDDALRKLRNVLKLTEEVVVLQSKEIQKLRFALHLERRGGKGGTGFYLDLVTGKEAEPKDVADLKRRAEIVRLADVARARSGCLREI